MRKGFGPKFWGGMKDVEVTFRQLHLNVNIRTYPYNYQKNLNNEILIFMSPTNKNRLYFEKLQY